MPINVASMFVSVGADVSGAISSFNRLDGALNQTAASLQSAGAGLTKAVTVPVVGAAAAVASIGIGFESAFVRVRKTVDSTTTDLDALQKGIIDLSATPAAGGKSAEELAKIAEIAGQLGVEGADNILNLTRIVAGFSLATGIAVDQATASLEQLRVVTGTPRAEFENLASTIVDLGNRTNATESQIIEFADRIAGSMHTVGATTPQILGVATALAQVGLNPEAAGTSISKFFIDMVAASAGAGKAVKDNAKPIRELQDRLTDLGASLATAEDAQKKFGRNTPTETVQANAAAIARYKREIGETQTDLSKLTNEQNSSAGSLANFAAVAGVTADEFKAMVKNDPTAAFVAIVKGLQRIQTEKGPEGVVKALEDLGITEARMRDTFLRLATGSDTLTSAIDIANKAWKDNNATQQEVEKAMQSTENQWNLLINQIKKEFIPLWLNELKPVVLDLMRIFRETVLPALKDITAGFSAMSPEQRNQVLLWGAIAVAAGPVLLFLGGLVAILGALISPIGLVVLGLAALAAIFATDFLGIRTEVMGFFTQLMGALGAVKEAWESDAGGVRSTLNGINDAIGELFARAKSLFETGFGLIVVIGDRIGREFRAVWEATILPALQAVSGWIGEHVIKPFLDLVKFFQGILTALFPGGAPGGVDLGSVITQGENALLDLQTNIAAGGPGGVGTRTFNAPLVQINNPVVTDQASVDELISRVGSWVTTALVESEKAADLNLPQPGTPGVPF